MRRYIVISHVPFLSPVVLLGGDTKLTVKLNLLQISLISVVHVQVQ